MSKKYWKGQEELEENPSFMQKQDQEFGQDVSVEEFLADEKLKEKSTPRRDFLKFLGFSVAAATVAACEAPVTKVIPYVNKPIDVTPGEANWYASTYYDGNSYANILVKSREGRPIYIKGNKDFGFTNGGINPQILASVLSLYNGSRLQFAYKNNQGIATTDADDEITRSIETIKKGKGRVVLVSHTLASPSSYKAIDKLREFITGSSAKNTSDASVEGEDSVTNLPVSGNNGKFEHIQYDAISYAGIRKANKASFGKHIIPDYDFSKAKTIVSFGADFLTTWLMATQYAGQYAKRRNPDGEWMNKHYQLEANMSITGSNADVRKMLKPSEEAGVLAAIIRKLGGSTAGVAAKVPASVGEKLINQISDELTNGGLVVSGSNNIGIQILVNKINSLIGAYNGAINLNNPINMFASEDEKMQKLADEIIAGKGPDGVIFYDVNPVYSLPNGKQLGKALANSPLTISTAGVMDETAAKCDYVVPNHHALESWNDYSPKQNEYAIAQPTIRPLYDTVQAEESFLVWSKNAKREGKNSAVYYDFIRENWKTADFNKSSQDFQTFWDTCVYRSILSNEGVPAGNITFNESVLAKVKNQLPKKGKGEIEVTFFQKSAIGNGNQAENPWLQEMPDPITKLTWDNCITMNPTDMKKGGYETYLDQEHGCTLGEININGVTYQLPVYPSPGQALGTVGIALGYGRGEGAPRIGKAAFRTKEYGGYQKDENGNFIPIGKNVFRSVSLENGTFQYVGFASLKNRGTTYPIATTQLHNTVKGRNSIIRETNLDVYKNHSRNAYNPEWYLPRLNKKGEHEMAPMDEFDLWDSHPVKYVGHRWGMSVDLNSCIGCGACLIACQAENNVPVVGKDEVRRGREMHWLRIDRYYSTDDAPTIGTFDDTPFTYDKGMVASENPSVVHQLMMCQQCNHAPCETVCPVAATTHSDEGLNQMVYNRCVGTRYCANNCPYKVRRFNWFNYPSYKKFTEVNPAQDEMSRLVLNPDVTVRTRGVMEKCSFCVQKIQEGKLTAKMEQRPVKDGDVMTACQEACPTGAIVVGDWNDPNSKVRNVSEQKRAYHALEEIGTKPNVWYQVKVRNEENEELEEIQEDKEKYVERLRHHGKEA